MAMVGVGLDRSMSPGNMKMMSRGRRSFPFYENVAPPPTMNSHGGLLQAPHPPLSFSSFNCNPSHLFNNHYMQQQQPPLLPLPAASSNSKPPLLHQSLPSRTRSLSRPPTARKTNNVNARSQSLLTPKKPIKSKLQSKKQEDVHSMTDCSFLIATATRLGPDPNDLPKDVTKVLSSLSSGKKTTTSLTVGSVREEMDNFSGSIFTLAPPPSSLPLPRFSLRRCKAEAVGVDAGATDNLCRLLRLR